MEKFLIIDIFGFDFLIRYTGEVNILNLEEDFRRYEGQDDTDEEMIKNILNKKNIKYEILSPRKIVVDQGEK